MNRKQVLGITLALGLVPAQALAAPSLWDPGMDIGGQLPQPEAQVEPAPAPEPSTEETKFTIAKAEIDAAELSVDKEQLAAILAPVVGREVTLSEVSTALGELTAYCRAHGYPAAAAYLPEQESQDGQVLVKIIPGRYGEVSIENHSRLKEKVAQGFLKRLKPGEIIRSGSLETALYSISDVSGTRAVGVLAPGKDFGTSDVTVRIEDGKPTSTVLYVENYGQKTSGRYRYGLQHTFYDVGGTGGRASLGTLISNSHLHNYYANYETPVGPGGATLGLGLSQMDYQVGGNIGRDLGAKGKAQTVSLFGSYPVYHTHDGQMRVTYGVDYRKLKDEYDNFPVMDRDKHSLAAHVGIDGSQQLPKTSLAYDAAFTAGHLTLDSDTLYGRLLDEVSQTDGSFTKFTADGTAVRSLGHSTDVMVKLSAQMANKSLDSSEQMYLGGANGVRAYPQGEASGDAGIMGTTEFRYYTPLPGLVLSTYFDAGHVSTKTTDYNPGEGMTLKGWGLAASYTKPGDWFARLDYARRIGDYENISEDAKARNRVWFLLGKIW